MAESPIDRGGRIGHDPFMPRRSAPATVLLIVLNLLAFGFEVSQVGTGIVAGGGSLLGLMNSGALIPVLVFREHQYWRLVTGAFLHGSVMHLLVNMYSLWVVGSFVEAAAGTARMVFIYAASLLIASLAIVYFGPPFDVTVGASGAIFGLFGALFAIGFKSGERGMRLVQANISILVINLVMTFVIPGISKLGHVGGLIGGFVVAFLVFTPPPPLVRIETPRSFSG
jgi:membrane associated rhomboid family serine protease